MGLPSDIVSDRDSRFISQLWQRTDESPRYQAIDVHRLPSTSRRPTRRLGRTTSARRACIQHRRHGIRNNQDTAVLRELWLPRDAVDPTSSVGGELHQPRKRVASRTLERLAASRMPEIAIEHYRESRIPGRRLNKREKRRQYLVFWMGYPPEEAAWEPGGKSRGR
jgi:hypothetical protein